PALVYALTCSMLTLPLDPAVTGRIDALGEEEDAVEAALRTLIASGVLVDAAASAPAASESTWLERDWTRAYAYHSQAPLATLRGAAAGSDSSRAVKQSSLQESTAAAAPPPFFRRRADLEYKPFDAVALETQSIATTIDTRRTHRTFSADGMSV